MKRKSNLKIKADTIKICHLSTAHECFDTRIFRKEIKTLVQSNYEAAFIVPHHKNEMIDGIEIIGIPKPKSRITRYTISTIYIYRLALRQQAQIYHFHDPELLLIGLLLSLNGKRVIYDVHEDLYNYIFSLDWIIAPFKKLFAVIVCYLEKFIVKRMDFVVAAGKDIQTNYIRNNPNTILIENFPVIGDFPKTDAKTNNGTNHFILHAGGIWSHRSIRETIEAIYKLDSKYNASLILMGNYESEELRTQMVEFSGGSRVKYLGMTPWATILKFLYQSSAAMVLYSNLPNQHNIRSNRLFEAMAAGVPVITSNFDQYKQFIDQYRCGLAVNPEKPGEIANAIQFLLDNPAEATQMGLNGKQAIYSHFNWEAEASKLLKMYNNLISRFD